jgi:signal transduction histidine kinase
MYAEMLKTGTVLSNEHKTDYYEFIHSESERLSRLIDNILQLSKLSQPQHSVSPQYIKLSILADIIRSKVSSLIENNDFQLDIILAINEPDKVMILVDIDAFSQVVINITDNAIKFFDHEKIKDKSRQKIDFTFQLDSQNKGQIILEIRDYGSGISAEQENKIFDLFYRGGSEMTRTTQGTGIGLALVNELVLAQQGSIQVKRMSPGLAMKMSFKCKLTAQGQNMN